MPPGKEEIARRVHAVHREHCPVYRSITPAIEVTTELQLESLDG